MQRAHPFEPTIHQQFGHLRCRHLVGAGAVEDDFAIARQLLDVLVEIMNGQVNRARNSLWLKGPRRSGPHINNQGRSSGINEFVELGCADPGHA